MLASLILFIIGFTMGGLNYVVTVLQGRTRGMTMMRLPLTVWGIFTATILALLAFPALFVASVMMLLDRVLGTSFFMPAIVQAGEHLKYGGGSPILFQHHSGSSAIPRFTSLPSGLRDRFRPDQHPCQKKHLWLSHDGVGVSGNRRPQLHCLGPPYVHKRHEPAFRIFFATSTLIIAIPTAIKVYNWVLTLWRGDIHLTVPMLFALEFIDLC